MGFFQSFTSDANRSAGMRTPVAEAPVELAPPAETVSAPDAAPLRAEEFKAPEPSDTATRRGEQRSPAHANNRSPQETAAVNTPFETHGSDAIPATQKSIPAPFPEATLPAAHHLPFDGRLQVAPTDSPRRDDLWSPALRPPAHTNNRSPQETTTANTLFDVRGSDAIPTTSPPLPLPEAAITRKTATQESDAAITRKAATQESEAAITATAIQQALGLLSPFANTAEKPSPVREKSGPRVQIGTIEVVVESAPVVQKKSSSIAGFTRDPGRYYQRRL